MVDVISCHEPCHAAADRGASPLLDGFAQPASAVSRAWSEYQECVVGEATISVPALARVVVTRAASCGLRAPAPRPGCSSWPTITSTNLKSVTASGSGIARDNLGGSRQVFFDVAWTGVEPVETTVNVPGSVRNESHTDFVGSRNESDSPGPRPKPGRVPLLRQ